MPDHRLRRPGWTSGITQVSVGMEHVCVLTSSGGVECQGSNVAAVYGNGSTSASSGIKIPNGLSSNVLQIAAGRNHTCALLTNNSVQCWGLNSSGQLGNGGTTATNVPTVVAGGHSWKSISAGRDFTCGITIGATPANENVYCWGTRSFGSIPDGGARTGNASSPRLAILPTHNGIIDVTAGSGAIGCALLAQPTANQLYCWGGASGGRRGDGVSSTLTSAARSTPQVSTLINNAYTDITKIQAGFGHVCGMRSSGNVICWGNNHDGQLGIGNVVPTDTGPLGTQAISVSNTVGIAVGDDTSCAWSSSGEAQCWGNSIYGQVGTGHGQLGDWDNYLIFSSAQEVTF